MSSNIGFRHDGKDIYFEETISWSKIGSKEVTFRYYDNIFTFDSAGLVLKPYDLGYLLYFIGFKLY